MSFAPDPGRDARAARPAPAPAPEAEAHGLYVYALVPAATRLDLAAPGLPGAAGPVTILPCGPVAALAGPAPSAEIPRARRNMLAHTRVIEEAMERVPLLPMRFGSVAPDAARLAARLAPRGAELLRLLERFAGRIEVGLRISWEREAAMAALAAARPDFAARRAALPKDGPAAYSARIELGREIAEAIDTARARAQKDLLRRLLPLAEGHVLKAPEEDVELIRADFLMPRSAEPAFARAVEAALAIPGPPRQVRYIAPAPIYNFVNISLDAGETGTGVTEAGGKAP